MKSFAERLDVAVMDAAIKVQTAVSKAIPIDIQLESLIQMSFARLTPEQQVQIVEQMGADWYLKVAARIEKRFSEIDSSIK